VSLSGGKVVFIGAGNMAEALVKGIVSRGAVLPSRVIVTDVRGERLEHFARVFGVTPMEDNAAAAAEAGVLILAVKPQSMAEVLPGLRPALGRKALVVSIAAGKTTSWIEGHLGPGARLVRAMPNTPALVGAGATAICGGRTATAEDLGVAEALFATVGAVVRVDEETMDAVTAVSGSGPAYVFFLMEAMLESAARLGMEPSVARQLVVATVEGAARLMAGTETSPTVLRERVTSKGGTTAAAFEVLRKGRVFDAFVEAILAAQARSRELSASG